MKILQLNLWGGRLDYRLREFLETLDVDFACLQEVHHLEGRSGALFLTLNEIKQALGHTHDFNSPSYGFKYMHRTAQYGNAVTSKHPFLSTNTIFTAGSYKNDLDVEKDDLNIRNLQIITTNNKGQSFHILNHHGHFVRGTKENPGAKDGNDETMRQMKLVAEQIEQLSGPIILAGDFNLSPHSASLEIVNSKLRNLSAEHGVKNTYTHISRIHEVCDYIFVNDKVRVQNFKVLEDFASDHKPLLLEFDV